MYNFGGFYIVLPEDCFSLRLDVYPIKSDLMEGLCISNFIFSIKCCLQCMNCLELWESGMCVFVLELIQFLPLFVL